jgi:hypothetical protein
MPIKMDGMDALIEDDGVVRVSVSVLVRLHQIRSK